MGWRIPGYHRGSTRPVTARCALPIRGATYIARRAMTGPGQGIMASCHGRDAPAQSAAPPAMTDNGRWSVADPRKAHAAEDDTPPRLPSAQDRLVAVIRSQDGTWHRPFTTFELAALQSLVDPEEQLELEGLSDAKWRERIGNAVPPDAAMASRIRWGRHCCSPGPARVSCCPRCRSGSGQLVSP